MILATMSLGAFRTVKASADTISCRSNLRQLGFAAVTYSADWDGNVVLHRNTKPSDPMFGGLEGNLATYLGLTPTDPLVPIPNSMGCRVWPQTDNYKVQQLTYGNYSRLGFSETLYTVDPATIAVNAQGIGIGPGNTNYDPDWTNLNPNTPLAGVTKTSMRPWLMDISKSRGDWLPWRSMGWFSDSWGPLWIPSFQRHRGMGNVVFFDLHAAPMTFNDCESAQIKY